GFTHDICSTVHVMAAASPFFRQLPLGEHGLEWLEPRVSVAHPLDDGSAALIERSIDGTAARLGTDARAYQSLVQPLIEDWERVEPAIFGPLALPRHPIALTRFGSHSLQSAERLVQRFSGQ